MFFKFFHRKTVDIKLIFWLLVALNTFVFAQRPEDGHVSHRKYGVMDANLCRIPFQNYGKLGGALGYVIEYPIGTGHQQMDGIAPLVATRIVDIHGERQACCETAYIRGDFADKPPSSNVFWAYEPLAGYSNPNQIEAAMSDDPFTWPDFWPDKTDDTSDPGWPAAWNGYFGKGVKNADLETYFVIDDDPDEEFEYYPDANDSTRRGLGTQMFIRSLQWNNILTESHNFWLYEVLNEGTTDYDSMYFALFADFKIGGWDADVAGYHAFLDVAFCYDYDNTGDVDPYSPVPALCYAYLESPTLGYDGIDNDEDGLDDEKRDSGPGDEVVGSCGYYDDRGIFDIEAKNAGQTYSRLHWSGDEDGDWDRYDDTNGNGEWDLGEPLNDDLGADGIGPFDSAYEIRDDGEGDGMPTAGEPDFDKTDIDEGDQMGLVGFWAGEYGDRNVHENDEWVLDWCHETIDKGEDEFFLAGNLGAWWHSGPIDFPSQTIQRFSFSLYFATGPSSVAQVEDAYRKKQTVQKIYNANYRFAQPPDTPKLTAIPGDGKVYLHWDDVAENSYDRFFQRYDFQGYSLYRSTDPKFLDARLITDGFGTISMKKPIFRCDKKDSISGFFPGTYNGIQFYIGDNSGLTHSYIDEDVINGQTYYYGLASFDDGFIPADAQTVEDIQEFAILPSECLINITIDLLNNIEALGPNCAAVTPTVPTAGYDSPEILESVVHYGPSSTTNLEFNIFNPNELKEGKYRLEFSYPDSGWRSLPAYQLLELENETVTDTLQSLTVLERLSEESRYFDGMIMYMDYDTSFTPISMGWTKESLCNLTYEFIPEKKKSAVNYDFDLVFTEGISDTSMRVQRQGAGNREVPVPFYIYSPTTGEMMDFAIVDWGPIRKWTAEDDILLVFGPKRGIEPEYGTGNYRFAWRFSFTEFDDGYPVGDTTGIVRPQPGDVFQVRMHVPPQPGEAYEFTSTKARIDKQRAGEEMAQIAVVPNPYVVTERWEPFSPFLAGRGPMVINFIHLPQKCTIRIFTVQGYLVDTIEHDSDMIDGTAVWDVLSKDNMQIAPGNYIYHVDAPDVGQKIGRFMVIK